MPKLPPDEMRTLSVGDADPSAVVPNTNAPGISVPSEGEPSTSP